jgi:ribonucleotide reductase alpha subunit
LEPWHADVFTFLDLKLNTGGDDTNRARDLFYALYVSDNFMQAVKQNDSWYLFDPSKVPKLCNTYGEEFTKLYNEYAIAGLYKEKLNATTLFRKIIDVQLSVGVPYLVFKDMVNCKSNLQHYAPIRSSNLCVAGKTMVLTEMGYMKIEEMVDDDIRVWNGVEWSPVTIRKTGSHRPMKRIHFNNGLYIDCTPQHTFYIQQYDKKEPKKMEACELRKGMILEKFDIPKWDWEANPLGELSDDRNTLRAACDPPWQGNKKQVMDWLQRRFSFNMEVRNDDRTREENMYAFLLSQLVHGQKDVQALVYKVDEDVTYGDTYCFTEHKRGRGLFNGLCTGQCAEIALPALDDEIGTCNLASVNLRQHLSKKDNDVR